MGSFFTGAEGGGGSLSMLGLRRDRVAAGTDPSYVMALVTALRPC